MNMGRLKGMALEVKEIGVQNSEFDYNKKILVTKLILGFVFTKLLIMGCSLVVIP